MALDRARPRAGQEPSYNTMTVPSEPEASQVHRSTYESWNSAVASYFFDGRWSVRPVYLDLEPEALRELAELAGEHGDPEMALTNAVRDTLELSTPLGQAYSGCIARHA